MLKKLRIKLFGKSKKELLKDMKFLCAELTDDLDNILVDLADIRSDLADLKESVNKSNRLILDIQDQCNQIMEKDNGREKNL